MTGLTAAPAAGLATDLAAALDPVVFAKGLSFGPERWQRTLLRTEARRVLVLCARQVGKTTTTAIRALHTAVYRPDSLILIVSPSQRQSDEVLHRIKSMYRMLGRPLAAERENGSELVLENGSRVVSLPGTEGTSRGFAGARLLIMDEAARIDDDIFASVLPMVAPDGAIWALSTPWGQRGWFYELHQDATAAWERHKITAHESEQYSPARIAEVKAALGSFVFASDYECVFGDVETQVFSTALVRAALDPSVLPLEF